MMKIDHAAMYVEDLEKAKSFFEIYFGAKSNDMYHNVRTGFRSYFLTFDEGARLEIMNKPGIDAVDPDAERMGFIHLAFSVGSRERVDSLTDELNRAGYAVLSGPRTTGDGYYESCVRGPEGNRIEITV